MEDLGSKILIGKEMCEIDRPLSRTSTSCFATFASTPCCFCSVSRSVQTSYPDSFTISPCRIKSFSVGRGLKIISSEKYLGAGHCSSLYDFLSQNELGPTNTPGVPLRSISSETAYWCSFSISTGSPSESYTATGSSRVGLAKKGIIERMSRVCQLTDLTYFPA